MTRRWHAEDISMMMELLNDGVKAGAIAIACGTTKANINHLLSKARRRGMAAFPSMHAAGYAPGKDSPAIHGEDAHRFLAFYHRL